MIASPMVERLLTPQSSGARRYFGLRVRACAWVLIPSDGARARDGFAIYNPQSVGGILKKALAHRGMWGGRQVYLLDRELREIEAILEERTGIAPLRCAFYFRSPGLYSKTIALALDVHGRAVAYVKFGMTAEGEMALAREMEALDRLAVAPALANCVPRVIGRARWLEYPMLLVSVGAPWRRCDGFGPAQEAFLRDLREATVDRRTFCDSIMWKTMRARFAFVRTALEADVYERYAWSLDELERRLATEPLMMSFAHRDFVPWNMHYDRTGALFVYDWELAQEECTPGWDFFHYHLAGGALRVGRNVGGAIKSLLSEAQRAGIAPASDCLLAYLTDVGLFLRDRQQRSPGTVNNTYVPLVEEIMDKVYRTEVRYPVSCGAQLAKACQP